MEKVRGVLSSLGAEIGPDNPNYKNMMAANRWAGENLPDPGSVRVSPSEKELTARRAPGGPLDPETDPIQKIIKRRSLLGVDI
jgi:hypothetical protein